LRSSAPTASNRTTAARPGATPTSPSSPKSSNWASPPPSSALLPAWCASTSKVRCATSRRVFRTARWLSHYPSASSESPLVRHRTCPYYLAFHLVVEHTKLEITRLYDAVEGVMVGVVSLHEVYKMDA